MSELLRNVNPVFFVFAFLTITTVVSSVGYYWHKLRKAELEASLKQEMIQRGMSADEIKQVIEASKGSGTKRIRFEPAPEQEKQFQYACAVVA